MCVQVVCIAGNQTRALGQGNALILNYILSPSERLQGHANLEEIEDRAVVMSAQEHNHPYFRDKVTEASVSHTEELAWSVAQGIRALSCRRDMTQK